MSTWFKENRFLKKLGQFQRLEQLGLRQFEAGGYSANYALWKMLQKDQLGGFRFEKNKRLLGNVVSFYCKEANLVVELQHPGHQIREKEEMECDTILQKAGITVLRFHKDAILERPNSVRNSILEELYASPPSKYRKQGLGLGTVVK
jgi:very-short-patch-repair endonuclease